MIPLLLMQCGDTCGQKKEYNNDWRGSYAEFERNHEKITTRDPLDRFDYQDREQPILQRGSEEDDYDVDGEHTYTRKDTKRMESAGHGNYPHRIAGRCRYDT